MSRQKRLRFLREARAGSPQGSYIPVHEKMLPNSHPTRNHMILYDPVMTIAFVPLRHNTPGILFVFVPYDETACRTQLFKSRAEKNQTGERRRQRKSPPPIFSHLRSHEPIFAPTNRKKKTACVRTSCSGRKCKDRLL